MEKTDIKRYYIMPDVWETVTQSQVFNWIKLINEHNISTDCISITPKRSDRETVNNIEKLIEGRFIEIKLRQYLILRDLVFSFHILKYYFKNIFKYKKIIFQTRMSTLGISFAFLSWLPNSKFIYEARGAHEESANKSSNLKMKFKNYITDKNEEFLITKTDLLFCVSKTLKEYYINRFKINPVKVTVFPGAADNDLFFNSVTLRKTYREELKINSNDIVIIYTGKMDKAWQIPDKIFEFFNSIYSKNKNFKLLLLTPDKEIAAALTEKNNLNDVVIIKDANLDEVNYYLNASDLSLLLREDIPLNNVASPTKFAEYLMTGLPVIVSKGIYDFADNINYTKFGVVVENVDQISDIEYKFLIESLSISREKIAKWGRDNLSKSAFIEKYVKVLIEN